MKNLYAFLTILSLASCTPSIAVSRPPNTPIQSFTSFPISTEALIIEPTSTFIPSPTLSSEQYPKLIDFVLHPDDIPNNAYSIKPYFWSGIDHNIPPSTTDTTISLKEKNMCSPDCAGIKWENSYSYIEISLVRKESAQAAIKASFDLCTTLLHDLTLHWETPWAPSSFVDCQSEMEQNGFTPYTWSLGGSAADVYGSVLIVTDVGYLGGDDMGVYKDLLYYLLELQIEKLKQLNYPVSS